MRRTIRIILDRGDRREDVELIEALEVDDTVELLVPSATTARGDATVGVAATGARLGLRQCFLRTFFAQYLRRRM